MNPELDKKLCDKYPEIFANRHGDMRTTAMCWGFECGDGWYHLIDQLCGCLQSYTSGNRKAQVVATQVKEKFGTLRFYYNGGDAITEGMVWLAEHISASTCEVCGSPGVLRGTSWISTRCDEHADGALPISLEKDDE